jgi:hypothetical protein
MINIPCLWPRCVYHGKHSVLISGINKPVYTLEVYEGTSKSFRTFIFSREMVRAGGAVIGRVWECHVTSQSGKPADLAV